MPLYALHDTVGEDLGVLEDPATNIQPGDLVVLADGRGARVTARAETGDDDVWAQLEVLVAPSSPPIPTWRAVEFPAPRQLPPLRRAGRYEWGERSGSARPYRR